MNLPVIAVFDVGKTNKKLFLFDEDYRIVSERSARFIETADEDGDACENLESLRLSVFDSLREVSRLQQYDIKAVNFSSYGASLVYINEAGNTVAPLYNYLKAYPEGLQKQFYDSYGGEEEFSYRTASPVLGSLNSGMQLYRLKYEKPQLFAEIKYALHLPQYLGFLLTGHPCSDITSIGCHTNLWDFTKNKYHEWVAAEGITGKLAPIHASNEVMPAVFHGNNYKVGVGLHDSSAALIPYLVSFPEPFVLISTGTWCISLNPFNEAPLTREELLNDCLCYMSYEGKAVKASRIFAGNEHEQEVKRIAARFNLGTAFYRNVFFDTSLAIMAGNHALHSSYNNEVILMKQSGFANRDLNNFATAEAAYHQLMFDIALQQYHSTQLVLKGTQVKRIFVDGGFGKNTLYMNMLATMFAGIELFAASVAQATAAGTALSVHHSWNRKALPNNMIELKYYSVQQAVS